MAAIKPQSQPSVVARPDLRSRLRAGGFTTTPGRLRLASIVLAAALSVLGIVGTSTLVSRQSAARAVGLDAAPLLVGAVNLYVSLADADATASNSFLRAGLELPDQRQRYLTDIQTAGSHLATIAGHAGSSPDAQHALQVIAQQLPVYAGLVEQARANNQQGFPVGAAYLRSASALMRKEILPQTTGLYGDAALRLGDHYRSGTAGVDIGGVLLAWVIALGILLATQLYVTRRTNRVLNPALVAATVLVCVVALWALLHVGSEQAALERAQLQGSDAVQVFSVSRILLLRMQSDESHALIAAGTGDEYLRDFDTMAERLGGADGRGGLLGKASVLASRTGSVDSVDALADRFVALLDKHKKVRELDDSGRYREAVLLSIGPEAEDVEALNTGLRDQMTAAQERLDAHAGDARGGFEALVIALPLVAALSVLLVLAGLQRRIGEYG